MRSVTQYDLLPFISDRDIADISAFLLMPAIFIFVYLLLNSFTQGEKS